MSKPCGPPSCARESIRIQHVHLTLHCSFGTANDKTLGPLINFGQVDHLLKVLRGFHASGVISTVEQYKLDTSRPLGARWIQLNMEHALKRPLCVHWR